MRNIKLMLQYDGTAYHGWQIQSNGITIQEMVEKAIYKITKENSRVVGCGRTDSGVHADEYVCNFFSESKIPVEKIPTALNCTLPRDIICIGAKEMPLDFHSKNHAKKKCYLYQINHAPFADVFNRHWAWHHKHPLDIEAMREATKYFVGTYDFVGFASAGFSVKTTVRTIYALDIIENDDIIQIYVTGNGFLYNMVRIIVGTLLQVGGGKILPSQMSDIIASGDRNRAGITAPAHGLRLWKVYY